jgi:hypothetical protein
MAAVVVEERRLLVALSLGGLCHTTDIQAFPPRYLFIGSTERAEALYFTIDANTTKALSP